MLVPSQQRRFHGIFRGIAIIVLCVFITTSVIPSQRLYAQALNLPEPGSMVRVSSQFQPAIIKGIKVDPNNPLLFNFLIDPGEIVLNNNEQRIEYRNLVKYFLAALTTPEKDMWVNLSPYEHGRMLPHNLSHTEMGRDMLAQDYILKQLTASLVYPEESLGKKFWNEVYERVRMETGSTANIPVNTFNKVWIIPQSATVFEKGNVAMVVNSRMKVLMEQDYLSLDKHANAAKIGGINDDKFKGISRTSSDAVRDIIIPAIEKEVNEGKDFAQIRQIYNSMILASWFKQRLKMHLLSKIYINKNENAGVALQSPQDNERIYQEYLQAFKKGVFNYIKEDADPESGKSIPRKYFSGGASYAMLAVPLDLGPIKTTRAESAAVEVAGDRQLKDVQVRFSAITNNSVINSQGVTLSMEDLRSPDLGEKLGAFMITPADTFNAMLFLANAQESPDFGKNIVLSAANIKEYTRPGLAVWGGDPQKIGKVISFLIASYLKEPAMREKRNIAFSISSNVWDDLHFQSLLSHLSASQNQQFADDLINEFQLAQREPQAGQTEKEQREMVLQNKVLTQLMAKVRNTQASYGETAWAKFFEGGDIVVLQPVLQEAFQADLEQVGVPAEEVIPEAKKAMDTFQLDFNFLSQVSITENDLRSMYGPGNEQKVKELLEKHDGFEKMLLHQQIDILLDESMPLGISPTVLINKGYDAKLVLETALKQGYTQAALNAHVADLPEDTDQQREVKSAAAAFLQNLPAMQLEGDALEAVAVVENNRDMPLSASEGGFLKAFKGLGFFKSLLPKLAAAAVFVATTAVGFAATGPQDRNTEIQRQIKILDQEIAGYNHGGMVQVNSKKFRDLLDRRSALERTMSPVQVNTNIQAAAPSLPALVVKSQEAPQKKPVQLHLKLNLGLGEFLKTSAGKVGNVVTAPVRGIIYAGGKVVHYVKEGVELTPTVFESGTKNINVTTITRANGLPSIANNDYYVSPHAPAVRQVVGMTMQVDKDGFKNVRIRYLDSKGYKDFEDLNLADFNAVQIVPKPQAPLVAAPTQIPAAVENVVLPVVQAPPTVMTPAPIASVLTPSNVVTPTQESTINDINQKSYSTVTVTDDTGKTNSYANVMSAFLDQDSGKATLYVYNPDEHQGGNVVNSVEIPEGARWETASVKSASFITDMKILVHWPTVVPSTNAPIGQMILVFNRNGNEIARGKLVAFGTRATGFKLKGDGFFIQNENGGEFRYVTADFNSWSIVPKGQVLPPGPLAFVVDQQYAGLVKILKGIKKSTLSNDQKAALRNEMANLGPAANKFGGLVDDLIKAKIKSEVRTKVGQIMDLTKVIASVPQAPEVPAAPVVQTPVVQTPVVQTPVVQTPVVQAPVVQAPSIQAPAVPAPVVQTPEINPTGPGTFKKLYEGVVGASEATKLSREQQRLYIIDHPDKLPPWSMVKDGKKSYPDVFRAIVTSNGDVKLYMFSHGAIRSAAISASDWKGMKYYPPSSSVLKKAVFKIYPSSTNIAGSYALLYGRDGKEVIGGQVVAYVGIAHHYYATWYVPALGLENRRDGKKSGLVLINRGDVRILAPGQVLPQEKSELVIAPENINLVKILEGIKKGVLSQDQKDAILAEMGNVASPELKGLVEQLLGEPKVQKKTMTAIMEAVKVVKVGEEIIPSSPLNSIASTATPKSPKKIHAAAPATPKAVPAQPAAQPSQDQNFFQRTIHRVTNIFASDKGKEVSIKNNGDMSGIFNKGPINEMVFVDGTRLTNVTVGKPVKSSDGALVYSFQGAEQTKVATAWDIKELWVNGQHFATGAADKGGIDFDAKYLQLNMEGDGTNMPIPKGFEWLLKKSIRGFNPQILNIRSGTGLELSFFKGLITSQEGRTAKADLPKPIAVDYKLAMKEWAMEENLV